MAIAGLRGTGDWGTDERPKNFREGILWLNPNGSAPLTALMGKMGDKSVNDPEYSWWEEIQTIGRLQVNGAVLIAGTTITVDNGLNGFTAQDLKPGDLLLVEEGAFATSYAWEIIEVTSITSATVFEATRGAAGSTATAISDNTQLTLIGSAYEEGSAKASANTRNPTKYYGLTQIFKDTYAITGTADKTKARTGDTRENDKQRKMFKHSTDMEMAFMFGKRHEGTGSGGKPKRYTGGLMYYLQAAGRIDAATAMVGADGINDFIDTVEDVYDYTGDGATGGDERIMFMGNGAATALNKAAKAAGNVEFSEVVKVYGMRLRRLSIPQGDFFVKTHPLMNIHPTFKTGGFIVDPPGVMYRYLAGRDTKFEDDIQTPGQDSREGQWLTEAGTEFHHMQTMKYLHGISWAAS